MSSHTLVIKVALLFSSHAVNIKSRSCHQATLSVIRNTSWYQVTLLSSRVPRKLILFHNCNVHLSSFTFLPSLPLFFLPFLFFFLSSPCIARETHTNTFHTLLSCYTSRNQKRQLWIPASQPASQPPTSSHLSRRSIWHEETRVDDRGNPQKGGLALRRSKE